MLRGGGIRKDPAGLRLGREKGLTVGGFLTGLVLGERVLLIR